MIESDYLRLLVEQTPDALVTTSPDGKVLYWRRKDGEEIPVENGLRRLEGLLG